VSKAKTRKMWAIICLVAVIFYLSTASVFWGLMMKLAPPIGQGGTQSVLLALAALGASLVACYLVLAHFVMPVLDWRQVRRAT
jgi:hypothetical protein